jgi:putative drug exporter of the RND superfamily
VRSLLVPATVSWLGRWNWWMPERGRCLLRLPAVIPAAEAMNTSSARAPDYKH